MSNFYISEPIRSLFCIFLTVLGPFNSISDANYPSSYFLEFNIQITNSTEMGDDSVPNLPRWFIMYCDYKMETDGRLTGKELMVKWCPEQSKIKSKMTFASSAKGLTDNLNVSATCQAVQLLQICNKTITFIVVSRSQPRLDDKNMSLRIVSYSLRSDIFSIFRDSMHWLCRLTS